MTTQVLDLQSAINKAMKDSLTSLFDCYWDGEYDEEFMSSVHKYRKNSNEWAKLLYNSQLKEEGGLKIECGPLFEFVEDVAKACLKQVYWNEVTQHAEKLLQRKK